MRVGYARKQATIITLSQCHDFENIFFENLYLNKMQSETLPDL